MSADQEKDEKVTLEKKNKNGNLKKVTKQMDEENKKEEIEMKIVEKKKEEKLNRNSFYLPR